MARGEIHIELSVSYADDPKVAALARWPKDARGARDLYVQMICYAKQNMTDGFVPAENIGKLAYPDPPATGERQVGLLHVVGLVEQLTEQGWLIVAFLKRNMSREQVLELSVARSEFGRRGGKRSGEVRRASTKAEPNAKQPAKPDASFGLNTESESESESKTEVQRPVAIVAPRPPTGVAASVVPTATMTQRSKTLTDAYSLAVNGMCKWPAINAIVMRAIRSEKWSDDEIAGALLRIASDNRAVTIDALRVELTGPANAPRHIRSVSTTDTRVSETLALAAKYREEGQ